MCSLSKRSASWATVAAVRASRAVAGRVLAVLDGGKQAERHPARLLGGQHPVKAEAHASVALASPVLNDVGAPAAGQDTDGEAFQLVVADDVVAGPNLGGLDEPFGYLGHGPSAGVSLDPPRPRRPCHGNHHGITRAGFEARPSESQRTGCPDNSKLFQCVSVVPRGHSKLSESADARLIT